jgi:hypothetical protein
LQSKGFPELPKDRHPKSAIPKAIASDQWVAMGWMADTLKAISSLRIPDKAL